jgi:hypothetical protein
VMMNVYTYSLMLSTGVRRLLFGRLFSIYTFLVATINDVLIIAFDTFVVAVTLSNTLENLRQLKEFQAKSLTQVIVEQSK